MKAVILAIVIALNGSYCTQKLACSEGLNVMEENPQILFSQECRGSEERIKELRREIQMDSCTRRGCIGAKTNFKVKYIEQDNLCHDQCIYCICCMINGGLLCRSAIISVWNKILCKSVIILSE